MKYGFNVYKTKVEEHVFWIAESKDLKGCVGQGETPDEAIQELKFNEEEWLDAAVEYGVCIPEPSIEEATEYSGKFMTRMSPKVHKEAAENAEREGISLNQYVINSVITANVSKTTAMAIEGILSDFKEMIGSQITRASNHGQFQYSLEQKNIYTNTGNLSMVL